MATACKCMVKQVPHVWPVMLKIKITILKNQFGGVKREFQDCHNSSWFHPGIPHMGIKSKETTTTWKKKKNPICVKMFIVVLAIAAKQKKTKKVTKKFCNKPKEEMIKSVMTLSQ